MGRLKNINFHNTGEEKLLNVDYNYIVYRNNITNINIYTTVKKLLQEYFQENIIKVVDLENEIWKKIDGYEFYYISNKRRVKTINYNKNTGEERLISIDENSVSLHNNIIKKYMLNKLMSEYFPETVFKIDDLENEIWKPIKGYDQYFASNMGRIKCSNFGNTGEERLKKLTILKNGYLNVVLIKNTIKTTYFVHRLIAETFLENPENKLIVNHKNSIRNDNRVENIEWCTSSENTKHMYKQGYKVSEETKKKQTNSLKTNDVLFLDGEEFRDINGYENIYQISNFGRCKSLKTNRILINSLSNEYQTIRILNKSYRVHRLVAETF
jgi:hypothetical protein